MSYFGKLAPCIAWTVGSLLMGAVGQAANIAYDSAADAVYSDGTMNGRNGGTVDGFGAWNVVTSGPDWGGSYTATDDAGWANTGTKEFRVNAGNQAVTDGYRPLTGGALAAGQSIVLTGVILGNSPGGRQGGFALTDASNAQLIKVYCIGEDSVGYRVEDNTGSHILTGVGYNWRHYKLDFTIALSAAGAYTLSATGVIPATETTPATPVSGSHVGTISTATGGITQFDLFAYGTDGGGDVNLETLAVVPEPASIALLGLASISLLARRRRA